MMYSYAFLSFIDVTMWGVILIKEGRRKGETHKERGTVGGHFLAPHSRNTPPSALFPSLSNFAEKPFFMKGKEKWSISANGEENKIPHPRFSFSFKLFRESFPHKGGKNGAFLQGGGE